MLFGSYRYSSWDGTQELFDIDANQLMDQLSEELLEQGDVMRALREMFRNGVQNQEGQQLSGLKALMERLKNQRRQQLQQHNMDSVVDDLKEKLEEILKTERQGIDQRRQEAQEQVSQSSDEDRSQQESLYKLLEGRTQRNLDKLENLTDSLSSQIQDLMDYDFVSPEAQQMFQELLDQLKGQMAQNISQQMQQQMQSMSPEHMAGMREMMNQLNQMMRDKMAGRQPDFDRFMQQFGHMFGPNPPQSFEELMEHLQQQLAQMQSMMDSMSPEMRQELEDALSSALDPQTQQAMAEFANLMEQLMPMDDLRRQYPFLGDDSLTMDQAREMMRELQELDQLEQSLQDAMRSGQVEDIDPDKLAELLGEDARQAWEQLDKLRQLLKEAGYVTGDDNLELTARGIRRIGQKALKEVFVHLKKDRLGNHQMDNRGAGGDLLGDTKQYEFGDPFLLDMQSTIKNAILRAGPEVPVRMTPQDFEIYRQEHKTRAATVFAMIHTQYPRDSLHVIGFSDYAREIKEEDLAKVNWNAWVSGTNLQHALMLSRKLLANEKGGSRQILLITDGEPTAHLEGGQSYFSYPPSYRTELETLNEVKRCTQGGIVINTFMLENNYQLVNFIDRLTRINRGRAFYSSSENLGQYVLVDYLNNRKKRVSA